MKRLALTLLAGFALAADRPKDSRTPAECAAIHSFNLHQRAENRGMRESELEPECAPPKKAAKSKTSPEVVFRSRPASKK